MYNAEEHEAKLRAETLSECARGTRVDQKNKCDTVAAAAHAPVRAAQPEQLIALPMFLLTESGMRLRRVAVMP